MQRIQLKRNEKRVLRLLNVDLWCPDTMPYHEFAAGCIGLDRKGLVQCAWASGHELVDAVITVEGKVYIAENPSLRNPINWKWILTTAIVAGSLFVAIAALMTARHAIQSIH